MKISIVNENLHPPSKVAEFTIGLNNPQITFLDPFLKREMEIYGVRIDKKRFILLPSENASSEKKNQFIAAFCDKYFKTILKPHNHRMVVEDSNRTPLRQIR